MAPVNQHLQVFYRATQCLRLTLEILAGTRGFFGAGRRALGDLIDLTDRLADLHFCASQRAVQRLVEIMRERTQGKPVHVNLMHANAPEEADKLKSQVMAEFDCAELFVTEFTPVMGAHTGPGLLGVAFYGE